MSRLHPRRLLAAGAICVVLLSLLVSQPALGGARGSGRCEAAQAANVCAARGDGRGRAVFALIRSMRRQYSLRAVVFGAWQGRSRIVTGAVGNALPGVPATRGLHLRIGNVTESFETTLLLRLVQQRRLRLSDRLSRWFPRLRDARQITVGMLAASTSGYFHYVLDEHFQRVEHELPFRHWSPQQLISIGVSHDPLYRPGKGWNFSDTNFVLLGEILRRVGRMPVETQIRRMIRGPLGMRQTQMTTTAYTPAPVLHSYTSERGMYEDATFWNPSWATYTGDMTSNLDDMGRWARAVGTGALLSPTSHARQIAPASVGLGRLTRQSYYGLGVGVANGWIVAGAPGLQGMSGAVAYLPRLRISVVIFATANPSSPEGVKFGPSIFKRVGALLAPASPPILLGG
jgi:CubicO group peptidase (beta-lactamase class C family)